MHAWACHALTCKSAHAQTAGNINQLLFKLEPYVATLEKTHGVMGEFVNPKYADAARTVFKKPTRLECMMQDYPKARWTRAIGGLTIDDGGDDSC